MTLAELLDAYRSGAFKIKYEDCSNGAILNNSVNISDAQANSICLNIGWTEYALHPFEIINKTNKLLSAIDKSLIGCADINTLNNTVLELNNRRGKTYGKTFDRVVFYIGKKTVITLIHGLENSGGAYTIYVNRSPIASAKCRTLSRAMQEISLLGGFS